MAFDLVSQFFEKAGLGGRIQVFTQSSATVAEAAEAVGCEPERIAKTLSFLLGDEAILIVAAGDAKVDNKKYKASFCQKAHMIPGGQVKDYTGHEPGGVCPFAVNPGVKVYLDVSLKRFKTVYPACGDNHSAVELSLEELETYSGAVRWVDVCKDWTEKES